MLRMVSLFAAVSIAALVGVASAQQVPQQQAAQGQPPLQHPGAAGAPFQLTPAHTAFVDQVLKMWEQESGKIRTYKCPFDHFQYQAAFANKEIPMFKNKGLLIYERPAKGTFKIEEVGVWNGQWGDAAAWPVKEDAYGEHFACDGEKIYIYNHRAKQLEISPIPPEMRGKQIVDGPLPFLFGAEAAKLNGRYWIRATKSDPAEIWLDAWPKFAADAANYTHVEVILTRNELLPKALKVYRPNGDEDVYMFGEAKVNDPLARFIGVFSRPDTPWGYDVVEHPLPQQQPPAQPQQEPRETRRTTGPARY